MHFQKILDEKECTQERLREIFTAKREPETASQVSLDRAIPQKKDNTPGGIRTRFESRIRSRILDGIGNNCRENRAMQAVDLAWDSPPIRKEAIPLMLWAQGKIKIEETYKQLVDQAGQTTADRFFKKSDNKVMELDAVRICETSVDLVKSYITRRHAAMDSLWSQLWPLFKYDPRGTDDLSLFRADVLTQRVDIMAEDYNYRHFRSQCNRQMLLYNFSCAFPRTAWDRKDSWRYKRTNTGQPSSEIESYIVREGLDYVNPHPSRVYYDASAPLPNINTDTGPRWIGYWDVIRYGSLLESNAGYFNLNTAFVSDAWTSLATQYSSFMGCYFNPTVMTFPNVNTQDPSLFNDQKARIGIYTSEAVDQGILVTQHFEKINPKEEGIGEYNCDVWLRLVVAGDCTVIAAEFMPSIPAAYGGININDGRFSNQSMAMQLLGYQDQATNIVTHMLQQLRASMIQLMLLDKDSLDPETIKAIEENGKNKDWWIDMHIMLYSSSKMRDTGFSDPRQSFVIVQNQITNVIDGALKALAQLLNLADRLLVLSPNEQGQPNPREVSAREVNEVSTSVQSIYAFINSGPREQVAAMKRMIFESLITCANENIRVPVEKRYTKVVIERAGFKVPPEIKFAATPPKKGTANAPAADDDLIPSNTPVMGNLSNLNYDYYFDSRDGSERQVNAQGAQAITGLLQFIFKIPGVAQKLGMKGLLDAVNLVIRMSGAPWNFQFDTPVGQSQDLPDDPGAQDPQAQMEKMGQSLSQLGMGVQKIEQVLMSVLHIPATAFGINPGAPGSPGASGPHTALHPVQAAAPPGSAAPPPAAPAGPPAVPSAAPAPTAEQTLAPT